MMKLQIARDARPQAQTLLLAAALSIALWFVPYASILTYPFKLFVTFIHEGGHALAAILTGNSVRSLSVAIDASGLTETLVAPGGWLSQLFISSAGYLGAIGFGALLLWLIRHRVKARAVLAGSAFVVLALTVVFGFVVPITNFSILPFTVISGVAISLALLASAKYLPLRAANFLVGFLAVQCVLNALFDLKTVLYLSVATDAQSDAVNMARLFNVWPLSHSFFWALVWIGVAFVILSIAMRAYAVARKKPSQPDLPFEDPLEV
ncbi:MAG: M50 family metallopeptidase [Pyrinomonadaceae bacterium]